jgi:hypothetical protein
LLATEHCKAVTPWRRSISHRTAILAGFAVFSLLLWCRSAPCAAPTSPAQRLGLPPEAGDYIYELKERIPLLYAIRGQVKLVVLGDSRANRGIDTSALLNPANSVRPTAFNLSVSTSGLDVHEILIRDYLKNVPSLEWIVDGLSPRVFNKYWTDDAGEKLRNCPGYAYYMNTWHTQWEAASPQTYTAADIRRNGFSAPWGFSGGIGLDQGTTNPLKINELIKLASEGRYEFVHERWQRFEALLDDLDKRRVKFLAFVPPVHYGVARAPCADDDGTVNAAYWALMTGLRDLEARHPNFFFYDLHHKGYNDFKDEEYFNWDHVNVKGAAKMTRMVEEYRQACETKSKNKAEAPTLVSITAVGDPTRVIVVFREPVDAAAGTATNYTIDNNVSVTAATYDAAMRSATLTTSNLLEGINYTLTVSNVRLKARPEASPVAVSAPFSYVAKFTLTGASRSRYLWKKLDIGVPVYNGRDVKYTAVPAAYKGLDVLQTLEEDARATDANFLSFDANYGVRVYVAYDESAVVRPEWLINDFSWTWLSLEAGYTKLQIGWRDFLPGKVTLGGNETPQGNMYVVAVRPWGLCPTPDMLMAQARDKAVSLYDSGKADEALRALTTRGLEKSELYARISRVVSQTEQAEAARQAGKSPEARAAADAVLEAEKTAENAYRQRAQAVIEAVRNEGEEILKAAKAAQKAGNKEAAAAKYWEAAAIIPDNPEVTRALDPLKRNMQFKINYAKNLRSSDPPKAIALCQEVLRIVPPSHLLYAQAKDLLDKMTAGK